MKTYSAEPACRPQQFLAIGHRYPVEDETLGQLAPGSSFQSAWLFWFSGMTLESYFLLHIKFWLLFVASGPETEAPAGAMWASWVHDAVPAQLCSSASLLQVPSVWFRLFLLPFD